jgi:hypothetical protein
MRTRIESVFQVSPATFWNVLFFDADYNARLYKELGFDAVDVTSLQELGEGKLRRTLRAEPPLKYAPDFLKKKLQEKLSYEEDGVYDPQAQRWDFKNHAALAPASSRLGGNITSAPHAEGMLHIVELEIHINALGLGGMIEKAIEKGVRESYRVTTRFTNDYAREKGLLFAPTAAANATTLQS